MSLRRRLEEFLTPGTRRRLNRLEHLMADITTSVTALTAAVSDVVAHVRTLTDGGAGQIQELLDTLAAERAVADDRYNALVAAEDAEDVEQNERLAEAKAATDSVLSAQAEAIASIDAQVARLDALTPTAKPVESVEAAERP